MALTALSFTLSQWADIATIVASVVAGLALLYAALQIRISTKVSRAGFWLELRKMFAEHRDLHLKLRKKEWPDKEGSCPGEEDWPALEAYMGLFEHCESMLDQGLIDWPTFKAIYGYRVENIIRNPWIVRHLYGYDTGDGLKLWLGYPYAQEFQLRFDSSAWVELEKKYHEIFRQVTSKPGELQYACLRKGDASIHSWSAQEE